MKIQNTIETKLKNEFKPHYLKVINESHMHSVPPGSESHFRVELVSESFEKMNRVARSRKVYLLLDAELRSGVHALSLKLFSPSEWDSSGAEAGEASPECLGGSKADQKS